MTRSAARTWVSKAWRVEKTVRTRLPILCENPRNTSMERSITTTSAPSPTAIWVALAPTTPPPMTTTFAGSTPGTPPSRMPRPPCSRSRQWAPAWIGHAPGDLGHGGEQGQSAAGRRHGLVGDADGAAGDQVLGLLGVGGQVQVGEQDLPLAQAFALLGLGFLDLDDHLGALEDLGGIVGDLGTGAAVFVLVGADTGARALFDDHVMAVGDHFVHTVGGQADPVFVDFDFLGNPD